MKVCRSLVGSIPRLRQMCQPACFTLHDRILFRVLARSSIR